MEILAAVECHDDEKAHFLIEKVVRTSDSRGFHRYQVIRIRRGSQMYEYVEDLGPSSKYHADPFVIPSFDLETVGSLRDYANTARGGQSITDVVEPRNMREQLLDYQEELWLRGRHISNIGPYAKVQRR